MYLSKSSEGHPPKTLISHGDPGFMEGQMRTNCSKIVRVLFGDKANGGNLEILKRGEAER